MGNRPQCQGFEENSPQIYFLPTVLSFLPIGTTLPIRADDSYEGVCLLPLAALKAHAPGRDLELPARLPKV